VGDGLIALFVLMLLGLVLLGPIGLALALVARRDVGALRRRLEAQERELAALRGGATGVPAGASSVTPSSPLAAAPAAARGADVAADAIPMPGPAPSGAPVEPGGRIERPATTPAPRRDLETVLGGQWLTWLGILAIFFGTAFFLATDLGAHPLAGTGQLLVGLLVGALFLAGGQTLAPRLGRWLARGLLGGGVALLYLSAYAAHAFHQLVPAFVVFPFLFGVAVVGTMTARREDSLMVAALTQCGALLTPFFLPAGRGESPVALFVYLAAVTLGTVLLSRRQGWPLLPLTGFLGTVVLVLTWWARSFTNDLRAETAAGVAVLWALHATAPFVAAPAARGWGVARGFVLVANGFLFELVVYELLAPELKPLRGLATALLALLYVAGARGAAGRLAFEGPARLTRLTGLGLAALAIPIQFDLEWVTLGWSLLALVLLHGGLHASGLGERLLGYGVLALAVLHALVFDTAVAFRDPSVYRPWINGSFLVGLVSAAALGLAAWTLARERRGAGPLTRFEGHLVTPLILVAAVVVLVRIFAETMAGFQIRMNLTGQNLYRPMLLTLTLVWAVYAGGLILGGFAFRWRPIRVLGIVLLALLMLKVFLLDIQTLEKGYRIASFVGVGLLLLLISILYQKERRST
jgi:uncharacterized membrane protein